MSTLGRGPMGYLEPLSSAFSDQVLTDIWPFLGFEGRWGGLDSWTCLFACTTQSPVPLKHSLLFDCDWLLL